MPLSISGRRVFLASPGDMRTERATCRRVVREFNEEHTETSLVTFIVRAWEDLPGGVGRPQDRINPKLDDCDFMILLLGGRWGTAPALDGPYSSGTEEEFRRCLDLLADPDAPMRDLLVLFKTLDDERLRDPGPQLLEVMRFRNAVEESKALHYVPFDSEDSLVSAIDKKLTEWSGSLPPKQSLVIKVSYSADPVEPPAQATRAQLLEAARDHARNGLLMQAEAAFAHAVEDGDVEALSEYARFMRRTGRLERALELNRQIIENPRLLSATDYDSTARRAEALANMGVIHRKRGSLNDSITMLAEAVRTAERSHLPVHSELCYALDNYGLSLLAVNNDDLAREQFEKAHTLRREFGTSRDLAQSAVNFGRRALLLHCYAQAEAFFAEALDSLGTSEDLILRANALCGLAESRLRQGTPDGVQELLDRALEINTRLGNSDGTGIAHALQARLLLLIGHPDRAANHVESCRQETEKTNNATGRGTVELLLALVAVAQQRDTDVRQHLAQAGRHARASGNEALMREIETTARQFIEEPAGNLE